MNRGRWGVACMKSAREMGLSVGKKGEGDVEQQWESEDADVQIYPVWELPDF